MKQTYFTSNTIETQAKIFLKELTRKQVINLDGGNAALLVLDMQDYFLDPDSHAYIPSAPAIIPHVVDLVKAFQKHGLPVIYTQHINRPDDAGMMAEWWRDLITPSHPLAGLSNHLPVERANVLQKTQYDAFYRTGLAEQLEELGVTDVVITGVMTHLCCETTARSAFVHGYRVWFTVDGTACYNPEFHLSALRNLAHGFATPVLTSELLSVL